MYVCPCFNEQKMTSQSIGHTLFTKLFLPEALFCCFRHSLQTTDTKLSFDQTRHSPDMLQRTDINIDENWFNERNSCK